MEVEYVQTLKDLIALNIYLQERQPWWRRNAFLWGGYLFVIALGLGLWLWLCVGTTLGLANLVFPVLFCVIYLPLWAFLAYGWKRRTALRVKHFAKRPENRRMLGWRRCSLQPDGLTLTTEDTSLTIKWEGVSRIAQTEEYGLLFITPRSAVIVPRRAFAAEEDFLAFVRMARAFRKAAHGGGAPSEPHEPDTRITRDSGKFRV